MKRKSRNEIFVLKIDALPILARFELARKRHHQLSIIDMPTLII
jgi:hypothetical protein